MTETELTQALHWRYATKRFDPARTIPEATWKALEEALVLTPSSFGLQPWKFLVITDADLKAQLVPASWNQNQVADCSHFVVFLQRQSLSETDIDHYLQRIAEVRNVPVDSLAGFRTMLGSTVLSPAFAPTVPTWAAHQLYIALGTFMTAAALLGVDTCPMEGFSPAEYDRILGLQGGPWHACVACAAGYRAEGDKYAELPKVRFPASEVIEHR